MNHFHNLDNQLFNLKDALRTEKQIVKSIIILTIMLPLSLIISVIDVTCLRVNIFLLLAEIGELLLTKLLKRTNDKNSIINIICLGGLIDLAEFILIIGVLVKFGLA